MQTMANQKNSRPLGLGFPYRAQRYQPGLYPCSSPGCRGCTFVDELRSRHETLSGPDAAYFVYESWPMNGRSDENDMFIFSSVKTRV